MPSPITTMTIRNKITLGVSAAFASFIVIVALLNLSLFTDVVENRLNDYELPSTIASVRNNIDKALSVPVAVTRAVADNSYVQSFVTRGEPQGEVDAWIAYSSAVLQSVPGLSNVSIGILETRSYYMQEGFSRKMAGRDAWFDQFIASGQTYEFNLDVDKHTGKTMLFINYRMETSEKKLLGIAGIGLKLDQLSDTVKAYKLGETGQVFLTNAEGLLQMHRNPKLLTKATHLHELAGLNKTIAEQLLKPNDFNAASYDGPNGRMLIVSSHLKTGNLYVVGEVPESEVYGGIRAANRKIIAVLAGVAVVALVLTVVLARSVTAPLPRMVEATDRVAAGDLNVQLETGRGDELGQLARSFNTMIQSVKYHQANLEHLVEERTAQLREKTNDIQAMLQNMPQGILTLVGSGTVHPEYSRYLETIFETHHIAGMSGMALLFDQSNIGADARSSVDAAVAACLGEDRMNFDFNVGVLASDVSLQLADGRVKYLEYSWSAICNASDTIEKLMVCVRDVTDLRRLSAEADKGRRELEMIGQILRVKSEKFREFIRSARAFIAENRHLIGSAQGNTPELVTQLFRNMHTIKGNARTYGLLHLTNIVHLAEQAYDTLRQDPRAEFNAPQLLAQLQEVSAYLDEYAALNDDTLGRKDQARSNDADAGADVGPRTLDSVLDGVFTSLPSLANELGKEPPTLRISDHGVRIQTQVSDMLGNVFMHLYRNAMDHGIETAEQRTAQGKPAAGSISLDAALDHEALTLRLGDDGKGLALGHIRQRALERGLIAANETVADEALAQLIFAAGFSTASQVTEVSGRGVGMDAVKSFIEREHGRIELRFTDEHQGADFRQFQTVITLPANCAVIAAS